MSTSRLSKAKKACATGAGYVVTGAKYVGKGASYVVPELVRDGLNWAAVVYFNTRLRSVVNTGWGESVVSGLDDANSWTSGTLGSAAAGAFPYLTSSIPSLANHFGTVGRLGLKATCYVGATIVAETTIARLKSTNSMPSDPMAQAELEAVIRGEGTKTVALVAENVTAAIFMMGCYAKSRYSKAKAPQADLRAPLLGGNVQDGAEVPLKEINVVNFSASGAQAQAAAVDDELAEFAQGASAKESALIAKKPSAYNPRVVGRPAPVATAAAVAHAEHTEEEHHSPTSPGRSVAP